MNNYAAVVISPLVMTAAEAAPSVQLDLRPSGSLAIPDLLDRGELDLAIGNFENPGERFVLAPLLEDPFVLAMRRGHPAAERKLTATLFATLTHHTACRLSRGEPLRA